MLVTRLSLFAAIVLIGAFAAAIEPAFLNSRNLANILTQSAPVGIIAIGMTFVIIAGAIDLSVGAIAAFAGVLFATLLTDSFSYSYTAAVAISLGCCAILGVVNGTLITRIGMAPFLATLGMMGIARGLAFVVSGGEPISGIAEELRVLFRPWIGLITPAAIILICFAFLSQILLASTVWGMRIVAVGSNEVAAKLSGLNVVRYKLVSFVVVAICSGVAGVLLVARLGSGQPLAGNLYELDAIAAAVIGGGSLSGGRGDIIGALLGVLLIVEMRNVVTILGLPTHVQPIFIGVLLIIAVTLDQYRRRSEAS